MKTGSLLVILAIVTVVAGAGLSFSGYNESLQPVTITSTQSLTTTSTKVMATVRTESIVSVTSSTISILSDVVEIDPPSKKYCGMYETVDLNLDQGTLHVSYSSTGGRVDFWLLNEKQLREWKRINSCEDSRQVKGVASRFASDSYDFTVDIQSSGLYYFLFLNTNKKAVSITLSVDGGTVRTEVTMTQRSTSYSTQEILVPTQSVNTITRSAGFGLLFFSGIALIIIGGIVLVVGRSRYRPQEVASSFQAATPADVPALQAQTQDTRYFEILAKLEELKTHGKISEETYHKLKKDYWKNLAGVAPSPLAPSGAEPATGKFCMNCGAALPAHVAFCNKCGFKQTSHIKPKP